MDMVLLMIPRHATKQVDIGYNLAGTNYNTAFNFPDPAEVGAYQIVIQPNLFSKQLMGNNENTTFASTANAPESPVV